MNTVSVPMDLRDNTPIQEDRNEYRTSGRGQLWGPAPNMIWYDMIWYDMIWYDIVLHFTNSPRGLEWPQNTAEKT